MPRSLRSKSRTETDDDELLREIKAMPANELREAYFKLYKKHQEITDGFYCHQCGKFLKRDRFYISSKTASGVIPTCKGCLYKVATNYDPKTKEINETVESIKKALQIMDLPFLQDVYEKSINAVKNMASLRTKSTAYQQYVVLLQSLPQYQGLSWEDSDYDEGQGSNKKAKPSAVKRFGPGYSVEDYEYLEEQYKDWTTRYEAPNKAEEQLFERLCFKQLEIRKATQAGESTKDLDKSFVELLGSLNLKPSQNNSNVLSEARTFGQLIEQWENEKPIPEPSKEFKDVDHIGQYIDVFFKGHLSKMMGLTNGVSALYEKFMKRYSAKKPQEYDEDQDNEVLFNKIFGRDLGGE